MQFLRRMTTSVEAPKRNIEIKAQIHGDVAFNRRIDIAKNLTKTNGVIIEQHDIFFKVFSGRLKLRIQVRNLSLFLN